MKIISYLLPLGQLFYHSAALVNSCAWCPFILTTDTSDVGLGAILSQLQEGVEAPILVKYQGRKELLSNRAGVSCNLLGSKHLSSFIGGSEIRGLNFSG